MITRFYEILFDPGQATCFTVSPKGTSVLPVEPRITHNFFSINALDPVLDRDPTEPYHSADRPRRADHNVICFRNILIESDIGSFGEQMKRMQLTELPWSTCVASGGKSLHFILSLRTALDSREEYSALVRRIYKALSPLVEIDHANKNPSRLSRCPEVPRQEKNSLQTLVGVIDRVERSDVEAWLLSHGVEEEKKPRGQLLFMRDTKELSHFTRGFLSQGAPVGQWNHSLFRAACDLCACGTSLDEAVAMLEGITGTLDSSDLATIRSAFRRASRAQ